MLDLAVVYAHEVYDKKTDKKYFEAAYNHDVRRQALATSLSSLGKPNFFPVFCLTGGSRDAHERMRGRDTCAAGEEDMEALYGACPWATLHSIDFIDWSSALRNGSLAIR